MGQIRTAAFVITFGAFGLVASTPPETSPGPRDTVRASSIPVRPHEARSGSEFGRDTIGWSGRNRQRAALAELESGNIPEFLRTLVPVPLSYRAPQGEELQAVVWVMPDYLAIGDDDDFLYIPLTRGTAMQIARDWGCVLPTPKIVDAIEQHAGAHLEPAPLPPGPKMRSSVYYLRHQGIIDAQREGIPPGTLIAGHKKDLVITNRLNGRADRVAIYGWHHRNGQAIQPLSTVHGARYADYSHGVRLVWATILVNGEPRSIYDVLGDPALAPLLTYEGSIRTSRQLMQPPAPGPPQGS